MKTHVENTIEELISYRSVFSSDSETYKKATDSINFLTETFTPYRKKEITFSYDENDNETYSIFFKINNEEKSEFMEVFSAEAVAEHLVDILNKSDIKETIINYIH